MNAETQRHRGKIAELREEKLRGRLQLRLRLLAGECIGDTTPAMQVFLSTVRVVLRQVGATDQLLFLELDSDPEVMRYLTGGAAPTEEEARAGMERIFGYQAKFEGRLGVFIAELREGGQFMGWFHLRPGRSEPDNVLDLELGYRLKRAFWNRGLATEVSRELVRYAFEDCGARSVFAQTMKRNLASRRVMEKVGMRLECEFVDSEFMGDEMDVRYRIGREEWLG